MEWSLGGDDAGMAEGIIVVDDPKGHDIRMVVGGWLLVAGWVAHLG
jgi:hypothetical protein